jgi:ABC-type multidrug transport system fused ATPase/permease subunit
LVGRSGSGKTTLANLLLRSYDPQQGAVLIDGIDIQDVTQKSLRRQIAVVPQEVDLFSRTIAENIAYGRPGESREKIEAAAKMALAHDFISKLEQGYDTVVGERGIKLSGGERQRIGIARAILLDPKILIMDEATSHLDTESERAIQQATHNLIKGRTSIIIAHRFSTILNADMILVFNHGRLEARGRHEELLRISPTYQKLYRLQFSHLKESSDEVFPHPETVVM